jgi:hypothetical protein
MTGWAYAADAEITQGLEPLFAAADAHICDVAIPIAAPAAAG